MSDYKITSMLGLRTRNCDHQLTTFVLLCCYPSSPGSVAFFPGRKSRTHTHTSENSQETGFRYILCNRCFQRYNRLFCLEKIVENL